MSDLAWSSPLSPERPPIPRSRDWSAGLVAALVASFAAAQWYTSLDHSVPKPPEMVEEKVLLSLGGSAPRRIEAPPPPPKDAPVNDKPAPLAERARDAAPIAPPPAPRPVATWTQGQGSFSSGSGGTAPEPSPPAPPAPPAASPPAPPPEPQVNKQFVRISAEHYYRQINYPEASIAANEEGIGAIYISVDRAGNVLGWTIGESAGHERLDAEMRRVAAKVRKIDPLPSDFPRERARIRIQITFHIARGSE